MDILFGAKVVTNLRNNGLCTKSEGERMLALCNNSGPLFIIGTCGISLFGNSTIGLLLFISHILGCISVGILFRFWRKSVILDNNYKLSKNENKLQSITFSNLGEILSDSIKSFM